MTTMAAMKDELDCVVVFDEKLNFTEIVSAVPILITEMSLILLSVTDENKGDRII
jgi:hypothetical protein